MNDQLFDVMIIGGSYAGLQGAMTLARCRRKVLIMDNDKSCNRFAPQAHNLVTYDDTDPDKIRRWAREQVLAYPTVHMQQGRMVSAQVQENSTIVARDEQGQTYVARKLLLATGLRDILPDIKGFRACWGKSVVHCPYCHGYEVRDQELGIMTGAKAAKNFLPLLSNWSEKLTFFQIGEDDINTETEQFLTDRNIKIVKSPIEEVLHENGYLTHVTTADGIRHHLDALFVSLPCEQQTDIVTQLGCQLDKDGFIDVNVVGSTNTPGVYAAGDCTTPMRAISVAIASGYKAGIGINNELVNENL